MRSSHHIYMIWFDHSNSFVNLFICWRQTHSHNIVENQFENFLPTSSTPKMLPLLDSSLEKSSVVEPNPQGSITFVDPDLKDPWLLSFVYPDPGPQHGLFNKNMEIWTIFCEKYTFSNNSENWIEYRLRWTLTSLKTCEKNKYFLGSAWIWIRIHDFMTCWIQSWNRLKIIGSATQNKSR